MAAAGRRRWTRASTCATPPSRSRRSSGSTASAPSPARCAGSSSSGSAPYSATSSPSRSRSGSRTAGASPRSPPRLSIRHLCSCLPAFFSPFQELCVPAVLIRPPLLCYLPSCSGLNFKSGTNFLVSRVCLFSCRPSKSSWVQREEGKKLVLVLSSDSFFKGAHSISCIGLAGC